VKLNPPLEDISLDRLGAALNRTKPFVDCQLTTSPEQLATFRDSLEKGKTTLASLVVFTYLSEIPIDAWLPDNEKQDKTNDQLD